MSVVPCCGCGVGALPVNANEHGGRHGTGVTVVFRSVRTSLKSLTPAFMLSSEVNTSSHWLFDANLSCVGLSCAIRRLNPTLRPPRGRSVPVSVTSSTVVLMIAPGSANVVAAGASAKMSDRRRVGWLRVGASCHG